MKSLQKQVIEYKKQIEKGDIQEAYRGIVEFIGNLRRDIVKTYPDYTVSGSVQNTYIEESYFHFTTPLLKGHNLKIVILFSHTKFQFEVWLCGLNKKVQKEYLSYFIENNWDKYRLATTVEGEYAIIDHTITQDPNFDDFDHLIEEIENGFEEFIVEIEEFLSDI